MKQGIRRALLLLAAMGAALALSSALAAITGRVVSWLITMAVGWIVINGAFLLCCCLRFRRGEENPQDGEWMTESPAVRRVTEAAEEEEEEEERALA